MISRERVLNLLFAIEIEMKVNINLKYLLWFLFFFIANRSSAQWYFELYQNFQSDTIIQCMDAEDGYYLEDTKLWIGTNHGVVVFSKFDTLFYDSLNSPLVDNHITAIDAANEAGVVWVGTNHGLLRLDPYSGWSSYTLTNSSLPSDSITCILDFSNDSVWIGTRNGLVLYTNQDDSFQLFNTENSQIPGNHIQCLERSYFIPYSYYPEPLYVGTDSGLLVIDGNQWKAYTTSNSSLTSGDVRSLSVNNVTGASPKLWMSSYGAGVASLYDTIWTFYNTTNQLLKTDSVDFIRFFFGALYGEGEIAGSIKDSVYMRFDYPIEDTFKTQDEIAHPVTATIINRGNGVYIWIATSNEIYRRAFLTGIDEASPEIPKWKAHLEGTTLFISELPMPNDGLLLKIYDLPGRCLFERPLNAYSFNSVSIAIPDFSEGIYFVQLQHNRMLETLKTVKLD